MFMFVGKLSMHVSKGGFPLIIQAEDWPDLSSFEDCENWKIQFRRFEELKTAYHQSGESKYVLMCWEPQKLLIVLHFAF